uniref:Uncharacterized protein n=1 Tax=Leersia perrieri TaxID=77586 RepID=A0A0D9VTN7_9ORYZ
MRRLRFSRAASALHVYAAHRAGGLRASAAPRRAASLRQSTGSYASAHQSSSLPPKAYHARRSPPPSLPCPQSPPSRLWRELFPPRSSSLLRPQIPSLPDSSWAGAARGRSRVHKVSKCLALRPEMDAKKKRNKKKKGNQGKNTGDVMPSTAETAIQCHNHESAPNDHRNGTDADDAMSTVGEEAPQYQNHEPDQQANHGSTNADDGMPSVGVEIPFENLERAITQENHKVSSTVHADQRSVEMSDSTVELEIHRLYEAKLDKLHEMIKNMEDEKSLWLQKVSTMENELEKLHNKVDHHSQNEVRLEEKINNIQNGYDVLIEKEEVLDNKVRCIEVTNDALTHEETSLKERLSGLEETNKALRVQVKVLEETSKNTAEENQRLAKSLNELASRLEVFEAKTAITEASMTKKGNELIADRSLSSSAAVSSVNNYSIINDIPSNAYAINHLEEAPLQPPETVVNDVASHGLFDVNEDQGSKQDFDEPGTSEEILPVALDDIQIHEEDPHPAVADVDEEAEEVPFSDAPIVGAPFRLISFVARYVSGADLVSQK